jgi:hypothetical protein
MWIDSHGLEFWDSLANAKFHDASYMIDYSNAAKFEGLQLVLTTKAATIID